LARHNLGCSKRVRRFNAPEDSPRQSFIDAQSTGELHRPLHATGTSPENLCDPGPHILYCVLGLCLNGFGLDGQKRTPFSFGAQAAIGFGRTLQMCASDTSWYSAFIFGQILSGIFSRETLTRLQVVVYSIEEITDSPKAHQKEQGTCHTVNT